MQKIETPLKDLYVIEPQVFGDDRGFFYEFYNEDKFKNLGIDITPRQGNYSHSQKGVLRGIHWQNPPKAMGKLVRCTRGRVWNVAVDLRKDSPTYLKWHSVELSEENKKMLYLPPGFGNGFYVLEECDYAYLTTNTYDGQLDANVRWDDEAFGIEWPLEGEPTLSERDKNAPNFKDLDLSF